MGKIGDAPLAHEGQTQPRMATRHLEARTPPYVFERLRPPEQIAL
jgi:hypothetical protein